MRPAPAPQHLVWHPLRKLSGYLGVIERNAGELTTKGGNVSISAGESVVMQQGSRINTAGGYQEFAAGEVTTTRLVDDGNIVEIARADPSVIYDGIYNPVTTTTDARWGTTTSSTGLFSDNSRFEDSHLFGAAAGNVSISAAAMALDGSFAAGAVAGPQQLDGARNNDREAIAPLVDRRHDALPLDCGNFDTHASMAMSCVAPNNPVIVANTATITIKLISGSGWTAPSTPPATAAETAGMLAAIIQMPKMTPA